MAEESGVCPLHCTAECHCMDGSKVCSDQCCSAAWHESWNNCRKCSAFCWQLLHNFFKTHFCIYCNVNIFVIALSCLSYLIGSRIIMDVLTGLQIALQTLLMITTGFFWQLEADNSVKNEIPGKIPVQCRFWHSLVNNEHNLFIMDGISKQWVRFTKHFLSSFQYL